MLKNAEVTLAVPDGGVENHGVKVRPFAEGVPTFPQHPGAVQPVVKRFSVLLQNVVERDFARHGGAVVGGQSEDVKARRGGALKGLQFRKVHLCGEIRVIFRQALHTAKAANQAARFFLPQSFDYRGREMVAVRVGHQNVCHIVKQIGHSVFRGKAEDVRTRVNQQGAVHQRAGKVPPCGTGDAVFIRPVGGAGAKAKQFHHSILL